MTEAQIPITHGKFERLDALAKLNGRAFKNDPVLAYMLLDMSRDERLAYLQTYWSKLIKAALLNDGIITEADGWKSASVMVPPGRSVDNVWTLLPAGGLSILWRIGVSGIRRMLAEYVPASDKAKRRGLRGQKRYYYIFSIGTEDEHRGKGLARAIMRNHQLTAKRENVPIWLEATTPESRLLYLSLGFEEIQQITLGKGKVNPDASLQPGGLGVPLWAMVWWPQSESRSSDLRPD